MTKMWPLCSKKNTTTTTTTASSTATTVPTKSSSSAAAGATTSKGHCCCLLTKLVRKLKRRSRTTPRPAVSASRQSSFQCRYDPLSYSLNFDTTGCGSLLDEDYYKFCAFSSRFVANPRTSCPVVQVAAGNSAH